MAEAKKKNAKYLRDKDNQKVKGIFKFHEVPGGQMTFVYKAYKEDPIEKYTLKDGEIYELPLGVARHLNKNCWYPEHAYKMDENGNATMKIGRKVNRCSFQSLEFMDLDDMADDTDIVSATPLS